MRALGQTLLDRDRELGAIEGALDEARHGRGVLVTLEGGAGAGKTALLSTATGSAGLSGMRVISARGGELEREQPFGVIRQLYEPVLAASPTDRDRLLVGAAAPAARALGLDVAGDASHAAGFAAMHAIYWLTAELSLNLPLLAVVDDAHWADVSSLRALDYLARRLGDLPIALVVAFRPDEPGAAADLLDGLRSAADLRVIPEPLGREAVALIVRERVPDADREICDACHAATAGNPLYVHELMRAVHINGTPLRPEDVTATSVRFLGDRMLRRVERVDQAAPALAQAMAVLGDGGRLSAAAEIAAVPAGNASDIAHHLKRIEVLSSEDPVVFVHPLIRGSIYDAMPETERQSAHGQAARMLREAEASPEEVAAHLSRLLPDADPVVAETLAAAAQVALARAAPDEAIAWLERALAEAAPSPVPGELLSQLGIAKAIRRDPTAPAVLMEACELIPDTTQRVQLGALVAELLAHAGQWEAALSRIEALELELDDDDTAARTELAAIRAVATLFDPSRVDDFDRRRHEYERLAQLDFWGSYALAALLGAEAVARGRPAEALAHAQRARVDGRLLAERGAGGWAGPHLVGSFIMADDLDNAALALGEVDAAARSSGSVFALMTAIIDRAWLQARRGDLVAAEADLGIAFDLAQSAELLMGLTTAAFLLIDVLIERSQTHIEDMLEQIELPADFLATASGAMLLEARGRVRLTRGDRESAIRDLRAAGIIIQRLGFGPTYSTWRSALALALGLDDRDEARRLAAEEVALARASGLARPLGVALRTLGMLTDPPAGIDLLRESVSGLESSPARLEYARSLVELGAALRRTNQRSAARQPLVAGLRLARECGAQRLSAQADQELQACGGRRPRLVAEGRDALTASELRVAQLAASGATNAEIAQDLYISLKTVETHLSRAYLKLGLAGTGSRARLNEVLHSKGSPSSRAVAASRGAPPLRSA